MSANAGLSKNREKNYFFDATCAWENTEKLLEKEDLNKMKAH